MMRAKAVTALLVSIAAVMTAPAWGATTYHLAAQRVDSDSFDNYDFTSPSVSSTNVDWPVTFLFYNNAEVDKIKSAISAAYPYPGGTIYGRMNNSFGWFYDGDRGVKNQPCSFASSDQHMRVYADASHGDRNWSPSLGFYVIGTTHSDVNECGGGTTYFGYSEGAENAFGTNIHAFAGWIVYRDNWDMQNPEPARWEGNHYWSNNGLASMVPVP